MGKVTHIKQRLHSDRLAKIYPRVKRENKDFSPEYITDEMVPFYPPQKGDFVCVVTKESPFDNYELATEIDLQNTTPYFNSLLIYRILKLLYGQPDILGTVFQISGETNSEPIGMGALDWGYTIRITDDLFAEIRSIHSNTRFRLRYWIRAIPKNHEQRKLYGEKMAEFFKAFSDCLEKNAHLFDECEIDNDTKSMSALSNIFAEKYSSAVRILDIAKNIDHLPERRDVEWGEKISISTGGSLYLSSAILFIIALESLINTIYHLLLKPTFRSEVYERVTIRTDLDVRIISAHLFCDGFVKPILTPNTELWRRLLKLRKFRNDVIHGNITPDHCVYALLEDKFTFFYCGVTDFRGRRTEKKSKRNYPTTMAQINLSIVSEIKETVDQVVQAIEEAADDEHKAWFNSWLWEAIILSSISSEGLTNQSKED